MRRYLVLLLLLVSGCAAFQDTVAKAAPLVDPLLRVIGFCQSEAPDRARQAVETLKAGDRMGALLQTALLVEELRTAGVDIPQHVDSDLVRTLAAIEGMQRGLRALDGRDKDGKPLPPERPAGDG